MKPSPKLLLAFAFTLSIGGLATAQDISRGQFEAGVINHACASPSIPAAPASSASGNHRGVTRYVTGFDGDHSLEAAIVAEQVFAHYSLYAVRLQFASGAEQSVSVTAPPGGLQPEMRDMSGDSVPNDLVLTSKLLRSPLIVLLNDGHDHLTVAISPGSFASGEGRASGSHQAHHASALVSSGFKTGALANGGGSLPPQLEMTLFSSLAQAAGKRWGHTSHSGRAPPQLVTTI